MITEKLITLNLRPYLDISTTNYHGFSQIFHFSLSIKLPLRNFVVQLFSNNQTVGELLRRAARRRRQEA